MRLLTHALLLVLALAVQPSALAQGQNSGVQTAPDDYAQVSELLRIGKLTQAQAQVTQYLKAKPRDPQMRLLQGLIQGEAGQTQEAINTFTQLTEDHPELPEPYNNLAVLYAAQGQLDKARAALELAIRNNPSDATAQENLGDVYVALAAQAYNRALQIEGSKSGTPAKLALIRELLLPTRQGRSPHAPSPAPAQAGTAPSAPGKAP